MYTICDVLNSKGRDVWSVQSSDTVLSALQLMAEKEIGAVLVFEGDTLVGIFSERDYARKVVLAGRSSRLSAVGEVMTSGVTAVAPERSISECMGLMTERRLRHLPVLEGARVAGVVSIGDLVKATIADQEYTIEQLQAYIAGA